MGGNQSGVRVRQDNNLPSYNGCFTTVVPCPVHSSMIILIAYTLWMENSIGQNTILSFANN